MPPASGTGSTRRDQIASAATRAKELSRATSTLTLDPPLAQRSKFRPQTRNLRGASRAGFSRQTFRPSADLADRLLRRHDVGLALLDHLAHGRPLEALVLEENPDDRREHQEGQRDPKHLVVRQLHGNV